MKIVLFANSLENYINFRLPLIKKLISNNYKVYIIIPHQNTKRINIKNLNFIHLNLKRHNVKIFHEIVSIFKIYSIYKKLDPDFVLHFTIKPNIYGSIVCRILNIKNINNITGLGTVFLSKKFVSFYLFLYKISLKKSFHNFFQNKYDYRFFRIKKIISNNASIVPGSGVNFSKTLKLEPPSNKEINFLFIGRLLIDKGIREYLISANNILSNTKYKNVNFHIVGDYDKSSTRNIDQISFTRFINNKNIFFHGYRSNLDNIFEENHCVVLPSYREGLSHSLLTACSFAKALIVSNVPGCNELVIDNYNGFLCYKKNSNSLTNAMEKFINLSYEDKVEFGNRSRKIASKNYDEKIVIDTYLKIIKKYS